MQTKKKLLLLSIIIALILVWFVSKKLDTYFVSSSFNKKNITEIELSPNSKSTKIILNNQQNELLETFIYKILSSSVNENAINVNATKLFADYFANEIKADEKYRGQFLFVTGIIESINRGIGEQYYLRLETNEMFYYIDAYFDKEYRSSLANLYKGQTISLYCLCEGFLINSPVLKNCYFADDMMQKVFDDELTKLKGKILNCLEKNLWCKIGDLKKNKEDMLYFYSSIFLMTIPDDNNYFIYNEDKPRLKIDYDELEAEFNQILVSFRENLINKSIDDMTLEEYIQLIKEERTKLLRLKK